MPEYPEVYVIRHGQTEWNLAGRFQGQMDSPLTAMGCGQAERVGAILARELPHPQETTFVTSPLQRAQQTAELAMGAFPNVLPELQVDDRLSEVAFGDWEGKTLDQIRAGWPDHMRLAEEGALSWHFNSPGGETMMDLERRAVAFLDELTQPTVVFTHGVLSRVLRACWLGLDLERMLVLPDGQGVIFHLSQELGHLVLEK